jgi:peptidoglycan hydrolase-like protein with peptidoglycan-binding domain
MAAWKTTTALVMAGLMLGVPALGQAAGSERVKAAQQALKDNGHDPGTVDGKLGPKTKQALRDYQKAQGITITGELDPKTMDSLGVESARTSAVRRSTGGLASPVTIEPKDEPKK